MSTHGNTIILGTLLTFPALCLSQESSQHRPVRADEVTEPNGEVNYIEHFGTGIPRDRQSRAVTERKRLLIAPTEVATVTPQESTASGSDACRNAVEALPGSQLRLLEDCGALLDLMGQIRDLQTLNWNTDTALDKWDGVVVSAQGVVTLSVEPGIDHISPGSLLISMLESEPVRRLKRIRNIRAADQHGLGWKDAWFGSFLPGGTRSLILLEALEGVHMWSEDMYTENVDPEFIADFTEVLGLCTDRQEERDYLVLHNSGGSSGSWRQVWTIDETTRQPINRYSAKARGEQTWDRKSWVGSDGTCTWPRMRTEERAIGETIESLVTRDEIGVRELDPSDAPRQLNSRVLSSETVESYLREILSWSSGKTVVESATVVDGNRPRWAVLQIISELLVFSLGDWDADGVVLVFDRDSGTWKTIYGIRHDRYAFASYQCPMRDMELNQNVLSVLLESGGGCDPEWNAPDWQHESLAIDLESLRIRRAQRGVSTNESRDNLRLTSYSQIGALIEQ